MIFSLPQWSLMTKSRLPIYILLPDDQTQLRKVLYSLSSRWQYPKWMSFLSLRRPKLHHLTALLCHLRRRRNPLKTHLDCISFRRRGAKEKDRGAIEYRVEVLLSVEGGYKRIYHNICTKFSISVAATIRNPFISGNRKKALRNWVFVWNCL